MIITLTGENSFGLGRELGRLTAGFVAEQDDLALERLDGEEAEFTRIREALTSPPFLASKKMVIIKHAATNKEFTEKAESVLSSLPETTDVILVEPKLDKRLAYYKFLKKATDFREFGELDEPGLAKWLTTEAKERGGQLLLRDAQYLVERVGHSQQVLAGELEKLMLYSPAINRETIDSLTEATPQSTVFQLLEAAFSGNAKRTLELYHEQRSLKVEPPQIIAMLTWQLHILAIVKAAGGKPASTIASEAKLSPYVIQKSQAIARQLSLPELKRLVNDLLIIDARSKRESLDVDEALQNYLLELTR